MESFNFQGKHVLLTGGAGFIGSHLVDRLIKAGAEVTIIDNLITGKQANLEDALNTGKAHLHLADISQPPHTYLSPESHFDYIFHLASPASPVGYGKHPIETYQANGFGTHYVAEYATSNSIPMLFTSTSEAYGDPEEHPQPETYWGHVNPIGVRACYDESKRFAEMLLTTWAREKQLNMRIVRIFNTYGPRMDPEDGRVLPNLVTQALSNQPMTIYGNGSQTRSFCFVDDLVEYIYRAAITPEAQGEVINIGNPEEHTIQEFAEKIKTLTNSTSEIVYQDLPSDDPTRRKPDITKAKKILNYEPKVNLDEGLKTTLDWFKQFVTALS
jgi:nucleoside-diphosphate-sugar epimerase